MFQVVIQQFLLFLSSVKGIPAVLTALVDHWIRHWNAFIDAFPNVFRMANEVVGFFSGVIPILLTLPLQGVKEVYGNLLDKAGGKTRLITLSEAGRAAVDGPILLFGEISQFNENTLIGVLALAIGRFLYHTFKKVKLAAFLFKVSSEAEMIAKVKQVITGKLKLGLVFLSVRALLLLFAWFGSLYGVVGGAFSAQYLDEHSLQQKNQKHWVRKRRDRTRIPTAQSREPAARSK